MGAALQALEETNEEDTGDSKSVVQMTLVEASSAAQALKIFVQENQSVEAKKGYFKPTEESVRIWFWMWRL